ncbi:SDR family oxidoreductase [Mucilaginibacter auburnensis]|uniref:NADP-dependent 3-hydroxy acid dehydrogenase YdfG n=1 Tax=Mucilaginibacter auburnensis TaxID=1457233 RepID=A0A2H9VP00_9SPHI|nr:SDR family oxidoreductase [Mucilaginibacter auburnensis]PJJ80030.1 NADP-dependent 3-hydroxy acid dehydrogenase YdfG [Mucilaginibacter auburnensis]
MRMLKKLLNKSVVITGASSGAGRAAAIEFALCGAKLTLAARNEEVLDEVAAECRRLGAEVLVVATDVTDAKAMISLANAANYFFGRIDVWVNNAGVLAAGPFDEMPMAMHEQVIRTNLLGYMNGAHAVLPIFKAQKRGIIINNISIGGFIPMPYGAGYTASKFALRGFNEALKAELTPWPYIYVCDLFPAFLDTPGIQHAGNYTGKVLKPAPPVYDPRRVGKAMVDVAVRPQATRYVGSVSVLLKLAHAIFPQTMANATAGMVRTYLKQADEISKTDGNVYSTVNYGMSPYGGFGWPGKPRAHRKYIAAAALVGLATGLWMVNK